MRSANWVRALLAVAKTGLFVAVGLLVVYAVRRIAEGGFLHLHP